MSSFFFFNDTATTEIYTLSLHDALPISRSCSVPDSRRWKAASSTPDAWLKQPGNTTDRKSTRLNSSHSQISYAVFCLKKKKNKQMQPPHKTDAAQPHTSSPGRHAMICGL